MNDKNENTPGFKAPEDVLKLSDLAADALKNSETVVIANNENYDHYVQVLKGYKKQANELTAKQKSLIDPLNLSKQGIWDFFKAPLSFLNDAEKKIKKAMIVYQEKLERERKVEEERLAKEAEKERLYQEGLAKKRLATAEKNGDEEKIEQVEDEIEEIQHSTVAPVVASKQPEVKGVSFRVTWAGEVTDQMALIKAVAAGEAPSTLLDVNMKVVNQMARAMKGDLKYPGIKAVSSKQIATRI